jgi:hypothetical protein
MMDLTAALHTAARRFCANQHFQWSQQYIQLVESGQDRVGKDYSQAAYKLFPRYRLDEAIEVEVERITGQQFHSLQEARVQLLDAWPSCVVISIWRVSGTRGTRCTD